MDVRVLRYFIVLAEERHFGRAAERLAISQPPLSRAIRQLEEELDVELLDRTRRQVELTPAGAALYASCIPLVQRLGELKTVASKAARGERRSLRIGFLHSAIYMGVGEIVRRLRIARSDLEPRLFENSAAGQLDGIRKHELDIAFVFVSAQQPDLNEMVVAVDPLLLCVARDHPLASRSSVRIEDVRHEKFAFIQRASSPTYHDEIASYCAAGGLNVLGHHEVLTWAAAVALVQAGVCVSFLPHAMARTGCPDIAFVPIDDLRTSMELRMIWSAAREDEDGVALALKVAREHIAQQFS